MDRSQIGPMLAGGRALAGISALTTPNLFQKSFTLDPEKNHDGGLLLRMFAGRELFAAALGAGLGGREAQKAAFRIGMGIDSIDALGAYLAYKNGRMNKPAAIAVGGIALGAVAMGAIAAAES